MDLNAKNIQLQYQGYLKTPLLWKGDAVFQLKQLELKKIDTTTFEGSILENIRLGKRVERFVSNELKCYSDITVLAENIQIQNGTTTVGEIDCILKQNHKPIHLEIIYKFYLYDERVGTTELDHWIGPNRRDSLVSKLTKLKEKQLPLLYNSKTKPLLKKLNIQLEDIQQQVCFKAQLFIPFKIKSTSFKLLNKECLQGFYIGFNELEMFTANKFYIPTKANWLQEIQTHTNWLTYHQFLPKVESILKKQSAPLCWMKQPNGEVQKFFVVWWN